VKAVVHHAHRGPFHWLGQALLWLGIGVVYVLVLAVPLALLGLLAFLGVRTVRRRREDALLSRT
jgi:nitric oxide reductase large subunit